MPATKGPPKRDFIWAYKSHSTILLLCCANDLPKPRGAVKNHRVEFQASYKCHYHYLQLHHHQSVSACKVSYRDAAVKGTPATEASLFLLLSRPLRRFRLTRSVQKAAPKYGAVAEPCSWGCQTTCLGNAKGSHGEVEVGEPLLRLLTSSHGRFCSPYPGDLAKYFSTCLTPGLQTH